MSFRLARRRQSRLRNRTDNPDERRRWRTRGAVRRGAFGPKRRLRWRRPWTGLLLRRCRRTIIGHGGRRRSSSNESARPPPRNSESRRSDAPRHRGRALSRAHPPRRSIGARPLMGRRTWLRPQVECRGDLSRSSFLPVVFTRHGGVCAQRESAAPPRLSPCSAGHRCIRVAAPCRPGAGHHRRRSACRRSLSRRRCRRQRTRRARVHRRGGVTSEAARSPPVGRQNCLAGVGRAWGRTRQRAERSGRRLARRPQLGLRRAWSQEGATASTIPECASGFGSIPNGWRRLRSMEGPPLCCRGQRVVPRRAATSGGRRGARGRRGAHLTWRPRSRSRASVGSRSSALR